MIIKSFEIVLKSSRYWGDHSNWTQLKWAVRTAGQVKNISVYVLSVTFTFLGVNCIFVYMLL